MHHLLRLPHRVLHFHVHFHVGIVVLLALVSAAAYGMASVLQHQAAVREPPELSMTAGLLLRLVRRPLWLVGNLLDLVGFLFQFLALQRGSLALVEPILVLSLVFALPVSHALARRRVSPEEIWSSLVMTVGLGLFLGVGRPGEARPHASATEWIVLSVAVTAVVGACVVGARGGSRRRSALLLAAGSGIAFGYVAAVAQRAGDQLRHGILGTLASWSPYALTVAAIAALLLTQSAFQAGELRLSLPTLTIAQPLVAIAIGQGMFAEHLRTRGFAPLWETIGLVLLCAGVVFLARPSTIGAADEHGHPPPGASSAGAG